MNSELLRIGRTWTWSSLGYYPGFCLEGLKKLMESRLFLYAI